MPSFMLTYANFSHRELRYNRNDAATLMNLCLALIVAVVLFVTGINRIENTLLCKAFAVLLHYFLLCCLLWVGCGGACMTILVQKGPDKEEYNPVLKYYLIAWGNLRSLLLSRLSTHIITAFYFQLNFVL